MELGLSLGDTSRLKEKPCGGFNQLGLGFNTTLSIGPVISKQIDQHQEEEEESNLDHNQHNSHNHSTSEQDHEETRDESLTLTSVSPKDLDNTVLQLDLHPHTPAVAPINLLPTSSRGIIFQKMMDLCILSRGRSVSGEDGDERQMGCDDDNNGDGDEGDYGSTRKKLRLSKEQSGFLEESFKEHNTLNPQKLALAKQLHLRPRQVEVWFQNRRARSKLK